MTRFTTTFAVVAEDGTGFDKTLWLVDDCITRRSDAVDMADRLNDNNTWIHRVVSTHAAERLGAHPDF